MKTSSGSRRFRLPIPWDLAIAVLTHTAHIGRTPFRTQRHGNGYLRLHQSRALRASIAIDIHSFAELDGATTIMAVDVTKGIRISDRSRQHGDAMLDQFKSGGEVFQHGWPGSITG